MIVYGVCWQDDAEPWGWDPLARKGIWRAFEAPLRRTRSAASTDLSRLVAAHPDLVFSVQEFEIE
jgi:hypothetical protein